MCIYAYVCMMIAMMMTIDWNKLNNQIMYIYTYMIYGHHHSYDHTHIYSVYYTPQDRP